VFSVNKQALITVVMPEIISLLNLICDIEKDKNVHKLLTLHYKTITQTTLNER